MGYPAVGDLVSLNFGNDTEIHPRDVARKEIHVVSDELSITSVAFCDIQMACTISP